MRPRESSAIASGSRCVRVRLHRDAPLFQPLTDVGQSAESSAAMRPRANVNRHRTRLVKMGFSGELSIAEHVAMSIHDQQLPAAGDSSRALEANLPRMLASFAPETKKPYKRH